MAMINLWITHHGLVVNQSNEIYINKTNINSVLLLVQTIFTMIEP